MLMTGGRLVVPGYHPVSAFAHIEISGFREPLATAFTALTGRAFSVNSGKFLATPFLKVLYALIASKAATFHFCDHAVNALGTQCVANVGRWKRLPAPPGDTCFLPGFSPVRVSLNVVLAV